MFLVLTKAKISAYIVSVLTVCFLFFIASNATTNEMENTEPTSVKVETNETKEENKTTNNTTNVNNVIIYGNTIQKYNFTY